MAAVAPEIVVAQERLDVRRVQGSELLVDGQRLA
jgi:hypothetical protein